MPLLRPVPTLCLAILTLSLPHAVSAVTFTDDFQQGLRPAYWTTSTNEPLYAVDDTNGDVRISKPVGGVLFGLHYMSIDFQGHLTGNFDVSVEFRDAAIDRVNGTPGNQVQLNVDFSGQLVQAVVRSDESPFGHNVHFWNGAGWEGQVATSDAAGTLRMTRTGATVSGYWNGTLLHSMPVNALPVQVSLTLQYNGTTDSTSVTFDDFSATAADVSTSVPEVLSGGTTAFTVFPNPFTERTTIEYTAPAEGGFVASVYDVTGRLVGRAAAAADARSLVLSSRFFGESSPGVYFVRVEGESGRASKRIVRLR